MCVRDIVCAYTEEQQSDTEILDCDHTELLEHFC